MGLVVVTAATEWPITTAEAKAHLKFPAEITEDDTLILDKIKYASEVCERVTGRALCTQTWKLYLDCFPADSVVRMPKCPLQSITTLKTIDTTGTLTLLASTEYKVDAVSEPGRIVPAYGKIWPTVRTEINAVEIVFVCGYGAPAAVPQEVKNRLKHAVNYLYFNRETPDEEFLESLFRGLWHGSLAA